MEDAFHQVGIRSGRNTLEKINRGGAVPLREARLRETFVGSCKNMRLLEQQPAHRRIFLYDGTQQGALSVADISENFNSGEIVCLEDCLAYELAEARHSIIEGLRQFWIRLQVAEKRLS